MIQFTEQCIATEVCTSTYYLKNFSLDKQKNNYRNHKKK